GPHQKRSDFLRIYKLRPDVQEKGDRLARRISQADDTRYNGGVDRRGEVSACIGHSSGCWSAGRTARRSPSTPAARTAWLVSARWHGRSFSALPLLSRF